MRVMAVAVRMENDVFYWLGYFTLTRTVCGLDLYCRVFNAKFIVKRSNKLFSMLVHMRDIGMRDVAGKEYVVLAVLPYMNIVGHGESVESGDEFYNLGSSSLFLNFFWRTFGKYW